MVILKLIKRKSLTVVCFVQNSVIY